MTYRGSVQRMGGIMPRWLTARFGWHAAEIGGPIQNRAFHCRLRIEPENLRPRSRTNQDVSVGYRRFHFIRRTATVLRTLEAA